MVTIAEYLSKYNIFTVKRVLNEIGLIPTDNAFSKPYLVDRIVEVANVACMVVDKALPAYTIVFVSARAEASVHRSSQAVITMHQNPTTEDDLISLFKCLGYTVEDNLSSLRITRD